MIGPGWAGENDERREPARAREAGVRRVAVVTGARSEYGLLRPVMRAIQARADLDLLVIAAGSHLVPPALTFRDIKKDFEVADSVPMQTAGRTTRADDAEALGRGVSRFTRSFSHLQPDWVVVLGDRIEAFAAACAASVGGWALAHIHGGDRAEGVADESMRHAITKLAHLHLAATETSADRIKRMGERAEHVRIVGSPAIDGLAEAPELGDEAFVDLGAPTAVFLMHPIGLSNEAEEAAASAVLSALDGERVLALLPNLDPGRQGVVRAIRAWESAEGGRVVEHLPRDAFVGLLKRLAKAGTGVLVGNSSAGLIECAAIGLPALDIGPRQGGRERAGNVVGAQATESSVRAAVVKARALEPGEHPYGDGRSGERIASALSAVDPNDAGLTRKRCAY